ncbi:MAG: PadR family transcriptional regulator [Steroidobacteraceae bacterium]
MTEYEADPAETDLGKWESQLRKGSLSLAVLATLRKGDSYGLEILRHLKNDASFTVAEGTIYPILSRLKAAGFVDSEWVEAEAGHPRKYFRLTVNGRRYLKQVSRAWYDFAHGMDRLLAPTGEQIHGKRRIS